MFDCFLGVVFSVYSKANSTLLYYRSVTGSHADVRSADVVVHHSLAEGVAETPVAASLNNDYCNKSLGPIPTCSQALGPYLSVQHLPSQWASVLFSKSSLNFI